MSALSDEETELFRELIEECDKKINCALLELKWNTDVSDVYIYEFSIRTSQVRIKVILILIIVLFLILQCITSTSVTTTVLLNKLGK